jgi:two-component system, OmpR family, sensor histidine kinase BaeS
MHDEPAGDDPRPWGRGEWPPGQWRRRGRWGGPHRGRGPGRRGGAGFLGCFVIAFVVFIGVVTALATWVAGAVLGFVAPGAAPSAFTAGAVVVVIVLAILFAIRVFSTAIRPLAELGRAAERLADGEPGVRVDLRGPRPVRGLAASFNAMADRLDRTRSDRQALLADVTHELRTPLTVVSGGIEAMLDGVHPLDEDHLAPLLAETRAMDRLLDDLRTLSLAEAGALPLHREAVDVRALADEVVAAHRTRAEAGRVALTGAGEPSLVTSIDPLRVREILGNLVGNALRHTPAGGHVTVHVRAIGPDAVLEVSDDGEGIPSDELGRVFDRFHRRADSGGSGLGLAIVRDLAAAHGGSVSVTSDGIPGRGSAFTVRLPLRD